ncbi:hypothetical protein HK102_009683 [Quaeritorhiza haematococci]|nr:hypothetical protein HK102_009683 [Quaeritorhiza haematococci]
MFFDSWTGLGRVLIVGPLAYFALILLLRASGNRTLSKMNAFDLIVTVAFASTLATVLLTEQVALAEGVLGFVGEPVLLVHRGEMLRGPMRGQRVIEAEVLQAVRETGQASIEGVDAVVLETDGTFSVVEKSADSGGSSALGNVARP